MSTTSPVNALRSDLRRILLTVPGLPEVHWEARRSTPVVGTPYLRERLDPVSSETATLGDSGYILDRFIYSLDLFWPQPGLEGATGSALFVAYDMADIIRATLYHGRSVGPPDGFGRIERCELVLPLESDQWMQIPIRTTLFVHRATRAPLAA